MTAQQLCLAFSWRNQMVLPLFHAVEERAGEGSMLIPATCIRSIAQPRPNILRSLPLRSRLKNCLSACLSCSHPAILFSVAIDFIILPLLTTLMTPPATALLCRHRVAHGRQISYGTAVTGGFIAALIAFSICLIRVARYEIWTLEYCICLFIGYGLMGLFGVLPALGVVRHYRIGNKC
jgi:hypothetical protein